MMARRQSAVVVSASPLFIYIILVRQPVYLLNIPPPLIFRLQFGIILIFASVIANSASVTDSSCVVFLWFFCVGVVIAYASLFAKTHRIWRIFANASLLKMRAYRDIDVAVIIVAATLVEMVPITYFLLTNVTLTAPPWAGIVVTCHIH